MIHYLVLNDRIRLPIELNIATLRSAQAAMLARGHDVNLLESTDIMLKFDDLWFVADLLLALTQEYQRAHAVSEADILTVLTGDVLDEVRTVLLEAYVDFFPGPETRESLRKFATTMLTLSKEKGCEIAKRATETLTNFSSVTGRTLSDSLPPAD